MCDKREIEFIRNQLVLHTERIHQLFVDLNRKHKKLESTDVTSIDHNYTAGISIKAEKLHESEILIERACNTLLGIMF